MPAITVLSIAAALPIQRVLVAVWRSFAYRAKKLERAIERERTDLCDADAGSQPQDPTNLLRARALELRLASRGITHRLASEHASAPPLAPNLDAASLKQARTVFCGG